MEAKIDAFTQNFIAHTKGASQAQTPPAPKRWMMTRIVLFAYYMSLARLTEPHKHYLAKRILRSVRADFAARANATP